MSWYVKAIKNYVNFSGRARRKEYWMFFLFNMIFGIVAAVIDRLISSDFGSGVGIVSSLYSLFVLLPGLSIEFRRLHDINKSAGWIFIALVPVIGWIALFIFSVMGGTIGDNKYGSDPKSE